MKVLFVCTANICRSASAAQLLRDAVATTPELPDVEVRSAGSHALPGHPGCSVAPALAGTFEAHRSQPVTRELVEWADLILTAARDHRPRVMELEPGARSRTFTIRQAGRIAGWLLDAGMLDAARERAVRGDGPWGESFVVGDPRLDVEPMPTDPALRTAWLLSEMDVARGLAGAASAEEQAAGARVGGRRLGWPLGGRRRAPASGDEQTSARSVGAPVGGGLAGVGDKDSQGDDIPDPHVLGMGLHAVAHDQITGATDALVRLLRAMNGGGGGQ